MRAFFSSFRCDWLDRWVAVLELYLYYVKLVLCEFALERGYLSAGLEFADSVADLATTLEELVAGLIGLQKAMVRFSHRLHGFGSLGEIKDGKIELDAYGKVIRWKLL